MKSIINNLTDEQLDYLLIELAELEADNYFDQLKDGDIIIYRPQGQYGSLTCLNKPNETSTNLYKDYFESQKHDRYTIKLEKIIFDAGELIEFYKEVTPDEVEL